MLSSCKRIANKHQNAAIKAHLCNYQKKKKKVSQTLSCYKLAHYQGP